MLHYPVHMELEGELDMGDCYLSPGAHFEYRTWPKCAPYKNFECSVLKIKLKSEALQRDSVKTIDE
jgi:hypothetical protein